MPLDRHGEAIGASGTDAGGNACDAPRPLPSRSVFIWALWSSVLVGCASYQPQPLSPEQALQSYQARSLDDPGLRGYLASHGVAIDPPIWDVPTLTLVAFYYHPDLDLARAQLRAADAAVVSAKAHPNPTWVLSPEYAVETAAGISPWTLSRVLELPIETAGKRRGRMLHAEQLSEAARYDIATVVWRVRSRVRDAALTRYHTSTRLELLTAQIKVDGATVSALEHRLRAGEASQPEVTAARLALQRTELERASAQQQQSEAQITLAQALGVPVAAITDLSVLEMDRTLAPLPPPDAQRQALLNRPDLLASLSRYAAAESALQLEVARQYPDVTFGPGYTWDQGVRRWSLGLSFTLPVFNQNQGPMAEAEAARQVAAVQFLALQSQVLAEIERAHAVYVGALEKLRTADRLQSDAMRQQSAAEARFQAGDSDRLERLGAEQEWLASRTARLDALEAAQRALGQLEDAIQRPVDVEAAVPVWPSVEPRH